MYEYSKTKVLKKNPFFVSQLQLHDSGLKFAKLNTL